MTCSIFDCCTEAQIPCSIGERELKPNRRDRPAVLLLASSDVLHAILSPYVHVELIDVRSVEEYRLQRIENAVSFPCPEFVSAEDISGRQAIREVLQGITAGALEKAFSSRGGPTVKVGTCLVVYDSGGDTMSSVGRAATFSQLLADLELVPEVGRIAGGFCAFRELLRCLVSDVADKSGVPQHGALGAPCDSPRSRRTTSGKWKVTIDPPTEVPPAEVLDGRVFLGNKSHANNLTTLQRLGVTHVLNVSRDNTAPWKSHGMIYCHCYVADSVQSDISRYFDQAYNFIRGALDESGGVVLVHCAGGVSRSSALVVSFLMRSNGWSLSDSLAYIRQRHPAAAPNYAFIHQLMDLESTLGVEDRKVPSMSDLVATGYSTMCETPGGVASVNQPLHSALAKWQSYAGAPPTPSSSEHRAGGGAQGVRRSRTQAWAVTPVAPVRQSNDLMWGAVPSESQTNLTRVSVDDDAKLGKRSVKGSSAGSGSWSPATPQLTTGRARRGARVPGGLWAEDAEAEMEGPPQGPTRVGGGAYGQGKVIVHIPALKGGDDASSEEGSAGTSDCTSMTGSTGTPRMEGKY